MRSIPDWQLPAGTDRGLWDYLHNREMIRNYDDFLKGTPLLEIDLALAQTVFPKSGRLIDLGCGTGRLLIPFAKRGFDCVGVDLSEAMLEIAGKHAREAGVAVELIQANLVELDALPANSFDYAACLFSTLGMIRGRPHRQKFLAHVQRILRPGGTFLVHAHHRRFYLGNPGGFRWLLADLKGLFSRRDGGDRTMPQHHGGANLTLHHFTRGEILKDLRDAGLLIREVRALSIHRDGAIRRPWLFGKYRTYGWLITAQKAGSS